MFKKTIILNLLLFTSASFASDFKQECLPANSILSLKMNYYEKLNNNRILSKFIIINGYYKNYSLITSLYNDNGRYYSLTPNYDTLGDNFYLITPNYPYNHIRLSGYLIDSDGSAGLNNQAFNNIESGSYAEFRTYANECQNWSTNAITY